MKYSRRINLKLLTTLASIALLSGCGHSEPSLVITQQFVSVMKPSTEVAQVLEINQKLHDLIPNQFIHKHQLKKYSISFLNKFKYHFITESFESSFRLRRISRNGKLFEV